MSNCCYEIHQLVWFNAAKLLVKNTKPDQKTRLLYFCLIMKLESERYLVSVIISQLTYCLVNNREDLSFYATSEFH